MAEHFDHEGAKKLREQKEREVDSLRKLLKQQDDVVAKQTSELSELNGTIRRMDANALQQRHEYDQVRAFVDNHVAGAVGGRGVQWLVQLASTAAVSCTWVWQWNASLLLYGPYP